MGSDSPKWLLLLVKVIAIDRGRRVVGIGHQLVQGFYYSTCRVKVLG